MPDHGWIGAFVGWLVERAEELVFAPTCSGCGWPGVWWCGQCRVHLDQARAGGPRCWRCDVSLPSATAKCDDCLAWPPGVRAVRAPYVYDTVVRSALHRVKYRGERRRCRVLADDLAARAPELLEPWREELRCVVPIPLHATRLQERGFNQSAVLATALARRLDLPLREELVRTRATPAQVGRTRAERFQNVTGAFAWTGAELAGTVLLVDDVVTTGATVLAAAAPLVAAGARAVVVLAYARARLEPRVPIR
ncbi:MAG: hypothetical protein RMK01_11285 [Thermomicrobium sp.]|nr:hypothetical protein [Thermomicrobium sp.]